MKTLVTPLLERDDAVPFTVDFVDSLDARQFVEMMDRHKALLFHGTSVGDDEHILTTEDFGRFVAGLQLERYPYVGGAAPRTIIPVSAGKDIVFTANERFVFSRPILLVAAPEPHNEGAAVEVFSYYPPSLFYSGPFK
jgi:hypothetical protein